MTAGKPNILLITTDQHRLSGVGAYGPTPCQTPNIDASSSSPSFAQSPPSTPFARVPGNTDGTLSAAMNCTTSTVTHMK